MTLPQVRVWIGLQEIDQPMRYAVTFFRPRFVRPDVHASIDLARIGRENLGPEISGDRDRNAAFPDRRRPQEHDQRTTRPDTV